MPKKRTPKPTLVGYRDIFDTGRKSPLVLRDCTSVEWPAGWNQVDADRWRAANGLERQVPVPIKNARY